MHCKAVKNAYGNPGSARYTFLASFSLGDFYFTLNVVQEWCDCVLSGNGGTQAKIRAQYL